MRNNFFSKNINKLYSIVYLLDKNCLTILLWNKLHSIHRLKSCQTHYLDGVFATFFLPWQPPDSFENYISNYNYFLSCVDYPKGWYVDGESLKSPKMAKSEMLLRFLLASAKWGALVKILMLKMLKFKWASSQKKNLNMIPSLNNPQHQTVNPPEVYSAHSFSLKQARVLKN